MDARKIKINNTDLDIILRHYRSIWILINHAKKTIDSGGREVLEFWDKSRCSDLPNSDVEIVIDGLLFG
jgi:hypothetical protein